MSDKSKTNYSEEEIIAEVKKIVGEILMLGPDEISIDSSLIDDLGMESIDFLDLVFRLEKSFGIHLPRKNPIQRIKDKFESDKFIKDGKLTNDGIKLLRLVFPEQPQSKITAGMKEGEIPFLITVNSYVNVVKKGLELSKWKPERCDKCGSTEYIPQDKENLDFPEDEVPLGPVFLCKSCNNMLIAPSFDEEIKKHFKEE